MTDPRQLLNTYAAETGGWDCYPEGSVERDRDECAPKAFAALRAILADCDFLDACIADYKGYEIAAVIRSSITKALEAK